MCYYESEPKICSKATIFKVNSAHICWKLEPVAMGHSGAVSRNFVVPRKVCFKHTP